MGLGIIGARRLMDQFQIDPVPGQRHHGLAEEAASEARPAGHRDADLATIAAITGGSARRTPSRNCSTRIRNCSRALEEIRTRQEELTRLNRELEDTNRGVVALYAELDEKADHLRRADELKSRFLSNMSHEFRSPLNSILALSGSAAGPHGRRAHRRAGPAGRLYPARRPRICWNW